MIEGFILQGVFLANSTVSLKNGVAVGCFKNERAINSDMMTPKILQRLIKATVHGIEHLVHVLQIRRVQAFKANEYALTATSHEEIEKFLIMGGIDGGLAHPSDA